MTGKRTFYLKEWRQHRELTQEQLAERAGISTSHLANVERGVKRYNEDILEGLAQALQCEPWELIGRNPSLPDAEVTRIWQRIPPAVRPQAQRTLESFAEPEQREV